MNYLVPLPQPLFCKPARPTLLQLSGLFPEGQERSPGASVTLQCGRFPKPPDSATTGIAVEATEFPVELQWGPFRDH